MNGWLLSWRNRWEKGLHKDPLLFCLWEYLKDHAEYQPTKRFVNGAGMVELSRGECLVSIRGLADFFDVGPRQIRTRLDSLESMKLATRKTTHLSTHRATVFSITDFDSYSPPIDNSDTPFDTANDTPTNPSLDKKNNIYIEQKKKTPEKRVRALPTFMPKNFSLTQKMRDYGIKNGMSNPESEFEYFVAHHEKKGNRFVSWEAAWRTWCMNHKKFKAEKGNGGSPRSAYDRVNNQPDIEDLIK